MHRRICALGLGCLTTFTAAALTACGGSATVDGDNVSATATASTSASASASSSSTTSTVTTTSTTSSARTGGAAPAGPGDQPAREVDSVPNQASVYTPAEEAYLAQLREHGLNIEGVEDQLTATGASVCANDTITRDAVAGQLVEQRRTDMDPAVLGTLITDTARANLC